MNPKLLLKAVLLVVPAGVTLTTAAALALTTLAADDKPSDKPATRPAAAQAAQAEGDGYPLDACPVGGKLGSMGEPVVRTIDGRTVKFCCAGCVGTFEKDPQRYHAKMDRMILDAVGDDYPLETCLVSGEDLDAMGGAHAVVHRPTNEVVKFCCGTCEVAFDEDPDAHLDRLRHARAAADAAE